MIAMESVPTDEDVFSDESVQIQILLVYEDRPTGLRAKCALDRALSQLEVAAEGQVNAWRLDLLNDRKCKAKANRDARGADILALSVHGHKPLDTQSRACLKQWIGLKRTQPCALMISLDANSQPVGDLGTDLMELCSVAASNHMTVLLQFGDTSYPEIKDVIANIHLPADSTSHVIETQLHRPGFSRQWGVND